MDNTEQHRLTDRLYHSYMKQNVRLLSVGTWQLYLAAVPLPVPELIELVLGGKARAQDRHAEKPQTKKTRRPTSHHQQW